MKIGLIAMSGIRVCDEELLRLGLTLPGFVERSKTIASLPSLGLLTLAGMTPVQHDVHYLEVPDIKALEILPNGFDLVAISSYSPQVNEAYELADRYMERGIPVIIGGLHATALPEEVSKHCTSVVIGEGETWWPQIIEDRVNHNLHQYYGRTGEEYDLANAPIPAFGLLDINKYNRLTVQTSRGCPHLCDFCASSNQLTKQYKQKPVDKVQDEIDAILRLWHRPFIEFADDNSMVNSSYWMELLSYIEKKNIRWFAETDISVSENSELLDLMRRSGCAQVLIGLESPEEACLGGIEMRSNWKQKKFSYYKEAIEKIQSHGITVNGCFVIGLDGHTTDIFDQVYQFVEESGLYEVQVTILTPFPNTPLYDRLKSEGRLIEPENWSKCTLFDVNFIPSHMTKEELASGFRRLVVRLYSEEFTARRRDNFKKVVRKYNYQGG